MLLSHLPHLNRTPAPWETGEKIPWHDPAFSARMLAFHLSQEHVWASRRITTIEQHIKWLAGTLPPHARILDLGCGPGLYVHRLARLGHACTGIDISPASVAHAQAEAQAAGLSIEYLLGDIRTVPFSGPFDLVMMTFGELNVFSRKDMEAVLVKAHAALAPQGMLLAEVHLFEEVRRQGLTPAHWQYQDEGLFCPRPHLCLQEQFWHEAEAAAVTRYLIVETATAALTEYGSTMQAYRDEEYLGMLGNVEGGNVRALQEEEWPAGENFHGKLQTFVVQRK